MVVFVCVWGTVKYFVLVEIKKMLMREQCERALGRKDRIGLCFSNKNFCLNQYIFIIYFIVLGVKPRVSCVIWQMLCHLVTSYSPTNKYFLHPDEYTRELTCLWGLCLIGEREIKYELL